MGISLWSYKLQAFFIGCVYAGVAGSLLIHYFSFASTDQFPFMDSVWYRVNPVRKDGLCSAPFDEELKFIYSIFITNGRNF